YTDMRNRTMRLKERIRDKLRIWRLATWRLERRRAANSRFTRPRLVSRRLRSRRLANPRPAAAYLASLRSAAGRRTVSRAMVSLLMIVSLVMVTTPPPASAVQIDVPASPAKSAHIPPPPSVPVRTGPHKLTFITPELAFSDDPTDAEISTARVFLEPL